MVETPGFKEVEAVLFASGKALEEEHIKQLTNLKPQQVKKALEALKENYATRDSALFIWNEGTKWKINVKEDYVQLIKTLAAETELSMPVLETLAVIAFRTPVLQSEIIQTRGDGAYEHIAELVDRGFITKEKYGRSFKLKIAEKFYNYFDVQGDKDIREAFAQAKQPDADAYARRIQKKLGNLQVVAAETDEEREQHRKERQLEIYHIEQQREDDKKHYLNDFESRLQEVKGRVDEAEQEIIEKKKEAEARQAEKAAALQPPTPPIIIEPQPEVKVIETSTEPEVQEEEESEEKDYKVEEPQDLIEKIDRQIEALTKKK